MTTVDLPAVPAAETDRPTAESPPKGSDQRRYRATFRALRPRRSVPAAIVAGLLTIGTLLVAAEVISRLVDRPLGALPVDWLTSLGQDTSWQDPLALGLASAAIAIGLLLLGLAIVPGRRRVVPLAAPDGAEQTLAAITRDGLARHAAAAAETAEGVDRAVVKARRGRIKVRAETTLRDPRDLPDRVRQAVEQRLHQLALVRELPVEVAVRIQQDGS